MNGWYLSLIAPCFSLSWTNFETYFSTTWKTFFSLFFVRPTCVWHIVFPQIFYTLLNLMVVFRSWHISFLGKKNKKKTIYACEEKFLCDRRWFLEKKKVTVSLVIIFFELIQCDFSLIKRIFIWEWDNGCDNEHRIFVWIYFTISFFPNFRFVEKIGNEWRLMNGIDPWNLNELIL